MTNLLHVIREKWKLLLLGVVVLGILVYLFFPRKLGTLCEFDKENTESITVHWMESSSTADGEMHSKTLASEEERMRFYDIMDKTYLHPSLFHKDYANGGEYVGYTFEIVLKEPCEDVPPLGGYFTKEIVSIDGRQYRFYGNTYADFLESLFA